MHCHVVIPQTLLFTDSSNPLAVDRDSVKITFDVESDNLVSFELMNPVNVETLTVKYKSPDNDTLIPLTVSFRNVSIVSFITVLMHIL